MSGLALLGLYAAATGWILPRALAGARWAARAPRAAIATWAVLNVACAVTLAMALHRVATPAGHGPWPLRWPAGSVAAVSGGISPHGQALWLGVAVLTALAVLVGAGWAGAARARRSHRDTLDLVARPDRAGGWWELPDDRPAAWCLPGRGGRVVLTRGAVRQLSPAHREAVLAHERAHLAGRHHLLTSGAAALGRALRWLPAARLAAVQVPLLVEMAADDAALRCCEPKVLAEALCTVAAGLAPRGTLGAGAHAVVARVQRLLAPGGRLPALVRGGWWAVVPLLPAVPVLLACGP